MDKPSCFLIMHGKTRVDYTPKEIRALSFDQVEEDGKTTLSWLAKTNRDHSPELGDTIVVWLKYPTGGPDAPLFRGKMVNREHQQDDHTLKITCQGLLGVF